MVLPESFHVSVEHLNVHRKILSLRWLFLCLVGIKAVPGKVVGDPEVSLSACFLALFRPTCCILNKRLVAVYSE